MKKIVFILLFLASYQTYPQDINNIIIEEKSGKPILIGNCMREVFSDSNFSWWYNSEYNNYEVNEIILDELKNEISDLTIEIVLATWCSDSRREVPRFYKILDYLEFPDTQITLIAVNRDKIGLKDEVDNLGIKFVPTMLIYEDSEEIGRIIETPQESLEIDLKNIITN